MFKNEVAFFSNTQATLVNSKPETPEYIDVQWVTVDSIDEEGTLVLVHDETREVTVVSLEITEEAS